MAVLRPDQAQLTFASEAAAGADQDGVSAGGTTGVTTLTSQVNPGDLSILVVSAASWKVGDTIVIGGGTSNNQSVPNTNATKSIVQKEIRKIEHINGNVVTFDRPLGFTHHVDDANSGSDNSNVISRLTAKWTGASTGFDKFIKFVPGVYETIDTPDPQMSLEPRYFLGTNAKRNFNTIYAGQQIYQGALSGIVLLNGWPLRFPIGKEIPVAGATTIISSGGTLGAASFLGDAWVKLSAVGSNHGLTAGDYIIMDYVASPDLNSITEIRKVRLVGSSTAWVQLETPLNYAHASGALVRKWNSANANYVEHNIVERTDLDSISMHVHMRDSSETAVNDFDRRWVGGKVGAISIMAEEGGLVTVNWDSILFKDMLHNQARHENTTRYDPTGTVTDDAAVEPNMPGYAVMNDIIEADVKFPTTQPYYFSEGTVSFFGTTGTATEFARIRNFSISINNNEDPRYYITSRYGDHRGPSEIREQRREYSMSCTVALPDTKIASDNTINNATSIFKELLLEGRYDNQNMQGFKISLKFIRAANALGTGAGVDDALYIDIPGPVIGATGFTPAGTPSNTSAILGNQGAFLRSAPHTITTEAPFQVACDFVFRNLAILIRDAEPVYP